MIEKKAKRVKRRGKRCPKGYHKTSARWCTLGKAKRKARKSTTRRRRRVVNRAPEWTGNRQGYIVGPRGERIYKHGPITETPRGFFGLGMLGRCR